MPETPQATGASGSAGLASPSFAGSTPNGSQPGSQPATPGDDAAACKALALVDRDPAADVVGPLSAGLSLSTELLCGGCQQPCRQEDSKPRSSRASTRWHVLCSSAYKYHQKQWAKEPSLKRAWQDKTEQEKVEWFRRKHAEGRQAKGVKRDFEIAHEEEDEAGQFVDSTMQVMYEPYSEFESRHLAMHMAKPAILALWRDRLANPANPRKKVGDIYLLGRFLGTHTLSMLSLALLVMRSLAPVATACLALNCLSCRALPLANVSLALPCMM